MGTKFSWNATSTVITAVGGLVVAVAGLGVFLFGEGIVTTGDSESGPVGASVEDLVHATVQIRAVGEDGEAAWWGSGGIISEDGLVLTAAHLVDNRLEEYNRLEIDLAGSVDETPEPRYRAKVAAVDYALDLAVLKIESNIRGEQSLVDVPFVRLGDSDAIDVLDRIRILGYPATGGATLTGTLGTVSGFASQDEIDGRAFIKTDAAVTGGSSGGIAVNDDGELIGIVVEFGSGSREAEIVDCRTEVADTNWDGLIDEADACVPLGGFINALRPVNLAQPLREAAESNTEYVSPLPQPNTEPAGLGVFFRSLTFSDGAAGEGLGEGVIQTFPSGVTSLCGSWEHEGMVDGSRWDTIWYIDGERSRVGTVMDQEWTGGEHGSSSTCLEDDAGLHDGLYELLLSVEGYVRISEAVFIGAANQITFSVRNKSSETICAVHLSPSDAYDWGQERLGDGTHIEPGGERPFAIPAGLYDVRIEDCDGEILDEKSDVDATSDYIFAFGEPTAEED